MDINLEKIELVKDRTGVSEDEAREALENADGSVVDAIVALEEKANNEGSATTSFKDSQTFKKMKELVEKGNISQIRIKKDGVQLVNFPVTVGVIGVVLVPWVAVIAAVTALGSHCDIELIDNNGITYDVNGKVVELCDKAKETVAYNKAKEYVDKGIELGKKGVEKASEYVSKEDIESGLQKAKEYAGEAKIKGEELFKKGLEKAEEYELKDKIVQLGKKVNDKLDILAKPDEVIVDEVEVVEVPEQESEDANR